LSKRTEKHASFVERPPKGVCNATYILKMTCCSSWTFSFASQQMQLGVPCWRSLLSFYSKYCNKLHPVCSASWI